MIDNMLIETTFVHTVVEKDQENYLEAYPNPTTGRVHISTQHERGYHIIERIELMDINGRILKSFNHTPTKFFIDIGDRPNGIYLLRIKTNYHTETFKIVLQK